MRITADTNVLLRAMIGDDETQKHTAIKALDTAQAVAVSTQSLCEFAWVVARGYRTSCEDIAAAIRQIIDMRNVVPARLNVHPHR